MNYKTLLRLKKNPFYILSHEQEIALAKFKTVKHRTKVSKHDDTIPLEPEKDLK
jgi:hypothetical protein